MQSIFELLELAEAIRVLHELGYAPREENFVPLTAAQQHALHVQGEDLGTSWYRITRGIFEDQNNPRPALPIVSESQRVSLLRAVEVVHSMTRDADREFLSFRERLDWLRGRLPAVLTQGWGG